MGKRVKDTILLRTNGIHTSCSCDALLKINTLDLDGLAGSQWVPVGYSLCSSESCQQRCTLCNTISEIPNSATKWATTKSVSPPIIRLHSMLY